MRTLFFDNYKELACKIDDHYKVVKKNFGDVSVIAKFNEIKEILAELICFGYNIADIRLEFPDWLGYNDEYILSIDEDGMWCGKAKPDGTYLFVGSDIVFISNECNSKVLGKICSDTIFAFEIGNSDDSVDESDETGESDKYNESKDMETILKSVAYSASTIKSDSSEEHYVNGKKVDREKYLQEEKKIKEEFAEFDNLFRKNILTVNMMMDEMNEWRKLLRW